MPPIHSRGSAKQYCAELEKAAGHRMELIVPEKGEAKGCDRATESRNLNGMGTADERLQGTYQKLS